MVAFGTPKSSLGNRKGDPTDTVVGARLDGDGEASDASVEKRPGDFRWARPARDLPPTDGEDQPSASFYPVSKLFSPRGAVSLEHWRGEVTSELRHIGEALTRLENQMQRIETEVVSALREHAAYHERNEERWGPLRWCERHPIRFAVIVAGLALWWLSSDAAIAHALVEAIVRGLR